MIDVYQMNASADFNGDARRTAMTPNKKFHFSSLLGLLGILLLCAFQNCSNVKFSAAPKTSESSIKSSGDTADDVADNDADDDDAPDKEDDDSLTPEEARLACATAAADPTAKPFPADGNLEGLSGTYTFSGSSINAIGNVNGQVTIVSTGTNAKINSLNNSHGHFLFCGFDVGTIEELVRGRIIVVGGDVGSVSGMHGHLTVVDGTITGTVTDSNGNINKN